MSTSSATRSDKFSTLPPELLAQIWSGEDLVDPSSVAICKALLPFSRANAYRHLLIASDDLDVTLAALGETLRVNAHLGQLIERIEVREAHGRKVEGHVGGWLAESFVAAFERMSNLESVVLHRSDLGEFLSVRLLRTAGLQSATMLSISSPDPIRYSDLCNIHLSHSLRELDIRSPMKHEVGPPSGVFHTSASRISKLSINAEPHSSEFEAFFSSLPALSDLHLRSGTTDIARVVASFSPSTRHTLLSLSFSATGYLSYNIDDAFAGFDSLQHLVLWSTQFEITPAFFSTLSPLPLVSVTFHGPRNPYLRHIIDFVANEKPATLGEISVDVGLGLEKPQWSTWRNEAEARRLADTCKRCGVSLSGSIREAMALLHIQAQS